MGNVWASREKADKKIREITVLKKEWNVLTNNLNYNPPGTDKELPRF
jgi:hypothetical protein